VLVLYEDALLRRVAIRCHKYRQRLVALFDQSFDVLLLLLGCPLFGQLNEAPDLVAHVVRLADIEVFVAALAVQLSFSLNSLVLLFVFGVGGVDLV